MHFFIVLLLSHAQLFWDPVDCSQLGSSLHGTSQARILEWVAISSSRVSSQPMDRMCPALPGGFFTTKLPGKPSSMG